MPTQLYGFLLHGTPKKFQRSSEMLYGPPLGLAYLAFLTSDPLGRRQADFLDLKDPGSHLSREGSHFIVEGPEVRDATMATCFSKGHFFYGI